MSKSSFASKISLGRKELLPHVRSGIVSLVQLEKRKRREDEEGMKGERWRGRARQKGSGSCPRLMHPWGPKGHETRRRPGSRKRKKKKRRGRGWRKERGPLTRWHTSTSISISRRRRREAYRANENAFARARVYGCTRTRCARAEDAGLR